MISHADIKFVRSLELKKNRQQHGLFVVEGEKLVSELFDSDFVVRDIFCTADFAEKISTRSCRIVTDKQLERLSLFKTPNKVVAVVQIPEHIFDFKQIDSSDNILILGLDGIGDPGNMGTILRIANWFGIRYIFCSPECVDCYSHKVVQSSMGAIFRTNVIYSALPDFVSMVKKHHDIVIFASTLDGVSVDTCNIPKRAMLLLGSESHGLSDQLIALSDRKLKIAPFPESNQTMESHNVAVAAGILCSEIRHLQRG